MGSLVTGIGYIGARLARLLLDSGEQVVGLDNLFSTDPAAIRQLSEHSGFTFVEGDVRDEAAVRTAFQRGVPIEAVYHLAAQASANPAAASARYTEETNLIGPRIVLDEAVRAGARCFVFGSSLQVYGRRVEGVVDEARPYGMMADLSHLSKVHVEKLMEMYAAIHGIRCVSARIGLVYGLGPVMKRDPRFMTAPNKFCWQAVLGERIRVGAGAYYPTGMIHVEDAARALVVLAGEDGNRIDRIATDGQDGSGLTGSYRAVNVVGETSSVAQVAGLVKRLAAEKGIEARVEAPADPPSVPAVEFRSALQDEGFQLRRSLGEGVGEVLEHFISTAIRPVESEASSDGFA